MNPRTWKLILGVSLLMGLLLRLALPSEIEYKFDEQFMFERSQQVGRVEPWPVLGMKSGKGIFNPPLSIWFFSALQRMGSITTPEGLSRAVALLGWGAILGAIFWGWRLAEDEPERRAWLWAAALSAVNPIVMVYERKIWAQSVLPILCVLLWICWKNRQRTLGAVGWGLLGSCLGQIHMSGFFLAAALVIASLAERNRARTRWLAWCVGSLPGAVAILPWVRYLLHEHPAAKIVAVSPWEPLMLRFWGYWLGDAFGLHLSGTIGIRSFKDFLGYPVIAGTKTWLCAIAHLGLASLLGWSVIRGLRERRLLPSLDPRDPVAISWWGCGGLLTLTGSVITRSYLLITHPLEWVWVARLIRRDRTLMALWSLQLLVSVIFLVWLSSNHGTTTGEFGVTLEGQKQGIRAR